MIICKCGAKFEAVSSVRWGSSAGLGLGPGPPTWCQDNSCYIKIQRQILAHLLDFQKIMTLLSNCYIKNQDTKTNIGLPSWYILHLDRAWQRPCPAKLTTTIVMEKWEGEEWLRVWVLQGLRGGLQVKPSYISQASRTHRRPIGALKREIVGFAATLNIKRSFSTGLPPVIDDVFPEQC